MVVLPAARASGPAYWQASERFACVQAFVQYLQAREWPQRQMPQPLGERKRARTEVRAREINSQPQAA